MIQETIEKARKLFKAFHSKEPRGKELITLTSDKVVALEVGELDAVIYRVKGQRKGYLHRFNKHNRPVLYVSFDGSQAYILAGGYRFTDRGFIG